MALHAALDSPTVHGLRRSSTRLVAVEEPTCTTGGRAVGLRYSRMSSATRISSPRTIDPTAIDATVRKRPIPPTTRLRW